MTGPLPSAGQIDSGVHRLPVRVYYEDTDFSGIVYHANYLRYFERGRSDCLRLTGINHQALLAREAPLVLAARRVDVTFLRPAHVDDALVVETRFARIKGPRLFVDQIIVREGETLTRAEVEIVAMTPDGRPRKIPSDVMAAFDRAGVSPTS